jgi:hypothetical protein
MYEVTRDEDIRRNALYVKNKSRRFTLADDGTILCLTVPEARELIEALLVETMRLTLVTEQLDHEE